MVSVRRFSETSTISKTHPSVEKVLSINVMMQYLPDYDHAASQVAQMTLIDDMTVEELMAVIDMWLL
jgi:hypothetical protein